MGNLNDLKLNTSAKEVQDALSKKVDKPTEEQVARRTVRMWKTGVADKSTDKTTPALGKFQSALHAKKEQRAKEEFDAKAVEEQQAGNVSQSARELADAVSASDADPSKLPRSPH